MAQSSETASRTREQQADAEHYRVAAEAALDQLSWCISYLHRIRKSPIAAALERNQSEIRKRLT